MTQPRPDLLLIGASAGGPAAFASILKKLPSDFPGAIVIAQHVDSIFIPTLASWLGQQCQLAIRIAIDGDRPKPGTVLIANSEKHLTFTSRKTLTYTTKPEDSNFHPSIDLLFTSAARYCGPHLVGVLLTGMGSDGAKGLKALRDAGALTIAQDAGSSAVYGMPKAAAEAKAAKEILSLDGISLRLTTLFQRNGE